MRTQGLRIKMNAGSNVATLSGHLPLHVFEMTEVEKVEGTLAQLEENTLKRVYGPNGCPDTSVGSEDASVETNGVWMVQDQNEAEVKDPDATLVIEPQLFHIPHVKAE
jgi:hypothetical protein